MSIVAGSTFTLCDSGEILGTGLVHTRDKLGRCKLLNYSEFGQVELGKNARRPCLFWEFLHLTYKFGVK